MARTESNMFPLGNPATPFELLDVISNQTLSLKELASDTATVIFFICNHCPFVKHINAELINVANHYKEKGISFIGINSNDADSYPDDSPENMKQVAEDLQYPFPYLYDETQEVARAYQAACTPDFYIFDKELKCVYRGQLDDSRPGNGIEPNGASIRAALDSILAGKPVPERQKPSLGCNIKWKSN
ncbi:Peroxiredoxin [Seinonella peptonophila]|uniref:Peroxiredoxin n=1 Tax=Seinonella peptonophila TaxID=112248 RepID=A0A1M4SXH6_9BACL|nr:thioredoxin family protein [Seinonella peptonophila]SHE36890.1 Peroxiredoxin [Seinonella peptonophila]